MVGEIRDEETASLAINAALTGHLVLSTLHTNSAAGALPRLLDMNAEAFLIASTTNLLVAQRLVRRLCNKCRKQSKITETLLEQLKHTFDLDKLLETLKRQEIIDKDTTWKNVTIYDPVGCTLCNAGYRGRAGIYELLEITPTIQQMITPQTTSQQLEEAARKEQGMVTMLEDGFAKAIQGVTTLEEVLRVAKE